MKRLLVIPLVLLILRRVDSQNMDTGTDRPCGPDNLSCINPANPDNPNDCLVVSQLCDGTNDCTDGMPDEGVQFATLDCGAFGTPLSFRCTDGQIIALNLLCDGMNDCSGGEDERSLLCENKCLLPYYGDCTFTRECVSTEFGQNCGACLPGFTPDLDGDPVSGPCLPLSVCPDPADIANGVVTFTGNSVGDTANYSCDSGFELIGAAVLTCIQVNGTTAAFSPAAPVCRLMCPDPAVIANGVVSFTGNSVGDTANYSCNSGFELIGTATLTCTEVNVTASAFLPAPPMCIPVVMCPDPVDVVNGMVSFTGNSVGDTANYSCNSGFELIGAAVLTCTQVNGTTAAFSPAAPMCIPVVMCPDPVDIVNGMVSFTGNSVGDTATYCCNSGFELIGTATLTCTEVKVNAAAFLPAAPVCRLITRGKGCIADGGICDPHFPTSCCSWKCPFGTSRCEPGENGCVFAGGKCHSDFNCCSFQCIIAPGEQSGRCEDGRNRCVYGGGGGLCNRDNDCCSEDCVGNTCAAPGGQNGCTVGGGGCTNDRDCCSRECLATGLCEAGENGCVFGGGSCRRDHNCCSGKCTNGSCEPGQNGCVNSGGRCDCFLDCCSRLCSHFGGCIDA